LLIAIDYVGEGLPAKHAVVATDALQLPDRPSAATLCFDYFLAPLPEKWEMVRQMSGYA
jgi:hypothetical protein